jgi:hypothetical protein
MMTFSVAGALVAGFVATLGPPLCQVEGSSFRTPASSGLSGER